MFGQNIFTHMNKKRSIINKLEHKNVWYQYPPEEVTLFLIRNFIKQKALGQFFCLNHEKNERRIQIE